MLASIVSEVWFSRDARQTNYRPPILEQFFGPEPPVQMSDIDGRLWRTEAYSCLDRTMPA
jgi:hypothetical protein